MDKGWMIESSGRKVGNMSVSPGIEMFAEMAKSPPRSPVKLPSPAGSPVLSMRAPQGSLGSSFLSSSNMALSPTAYRGSAGRETSPDDASPSLTRRKSHVERAADATKDYRDIWLSP
mmetsp:Transcript_17960/g.37241  ORF Transcript_17960/g.37241 Transcript_17960/m.37241 type:complete len:117 (-) Transcript_17960:387-737(-)|eukprot:CAMPEP_0184681976 /NCGR_PEP_ID=MMETSP0312-20130426/5145_1 /TAXON_ID=31354 /ORGANISM="Compsopogon coeruleus, Strain SAG 36.94" /LENGTH=116 /DNA_ID=CAMNT_0027133165 /DNA_START=172 /DNA_END=522 /DNA_ORIENTATION=+